MTTATASAASDGGSEELKRNIFDTVIAVVGLVVLSPLLFVIAVLIKLESPGPILFRQKRVGRGEKLFEIRKFRSMTVAPAGQATVPETEAAGGIDAFLFRPVGRKTVIGRTLRACSLDELPNLLNVLRGELHLVGPRPDEPELVAQYRPEWRKRHDVRPGITGLAQVNGRADLTYGETMAYDLDYVQNHPFSRDVRIILRTLGAVLRREGAR